MVTNFHRRRWVSTSLICSVLAIAGCSSARPPVAPIAQAELAVRQAEESKASLHAPSELRVAREKLMGAQQAVAEDEYEDARRLAEQAIVDAQLAQEKAEAIEESQNAHEVRETTDALRREAQRPTTSLTTP